MSRAKGHLQKNITKVEKLSIVTAHTAAKCGGRGKTKHLAPVR